MRKPVTRVSAPSARRLAPAPRRIASIRSRLATWYRRHGRDLPWRRSRDPWSVWVSEVLLQQTTVTAGLPRWERFLARFPTVEALAAATRDEVLAEWSGLGYYARARNLHRAARRVAETGAFPSDAVGWRRLPGIGPYTAAALASILADERAAVVDGNVVRVLSRLEAIDLDPKSAAGARRLAELAAALVPARRAGDHNQALMDLGATVCLPRSPRCPSCPLATLCAARAGGFEKSLPRRAPRRAPRRIRVASGVALRNGRVVLVPDREYVKGHWNVPTVRLPDAPDGAQADAARALRSAWPSVAGRRARAVESIGAFSHSVLERLYRVELFAVRESPAAGTGEGKGIRPVRTEEPSAPALPHGGALSKALARLSPSARESSPRGRARPRRSAR